MRKSDFLLKKLFLSEKCGFRSPRIHGKSVFFIWLFRRKSVYLHHQNHRKSVIMLYRKIEKYIVSHLKSGSNKILIVDGARQSRQKMKCCFRTIGKI